MPEQSEPRVAMLQDAEAGERERAMEPSLAGVAL